VDYPGDVNHVEITPQNDQSDERTRNIVFDRNVLIGGANTQDNLLVSAREATAANNTFRIESNRYVVPSSAASNRRRRRTRSTTTRSMRLCMPVRCSRPPCEQPHLFRTLALRIIYVATLGCLPGRHASGTRHEQRRLPQFPERGREPAIRRAAASRSRVQTHEELPRADPTRMTKRYRSDG
jgi:hypothetical protein